MTVPVGYDLLAARPRLRRIDAVTLLTIYLLLLMGLPALLVLAPLGAAGGPATMLAALLFLYYLVTWLHPGLTLDRGPQPIRVAATFFAFSILASYVSATRHAMPILEQNAADRGLIFLFGWLAVLLLAADGINNMDRLVTLVRRIVYGATAMAILGVTQFAIGLDAAKYIKIPGLVYQVPFTDLLSRQAFNRPSATASHPIEFGAVLAMSLPLAIHQARYALPSLRRRRWVQVALIGTTLPMTVSRSALLGLAVGAIVILPTWPKRDRRIAYVAMVLASLGLWATVHGLAGTIKSLFVNIGSDSSTTSRTGAFSAAGYYLRQNPWFGRGFGTFLPQTYRFLDDQYLGTLIETGIIGFVALLMIFFTGWRIARAARRATADPERRHLAQCLAACVAVATVSFATFDALSFPMAAGLTFLLLGCCGTVWRLLRRDNPALRPDRDMPRRTTAQAASR